VGHNNNSSITGAGGNAGGIRHAGYNTVTTDEDTRKTGSRVGSKRKTGSHKHALSSEEALLDIIESSGGSSIATGERKNSDESNNTEGGAPTPLLGVFLKSGGA
jgi:hypothetical protein